MKDWLLKDEKSKVGRPKLADEPIVKKAKILIAFCLFICFVLAFCFASIIKGVSPASFAYELTIQKLVGMSNNPNGFLVKDYYDYGHDYVMEIKVPDVIDRYSGSYKYTTYYLKGNDWVESGSEVFEKGERLIKVKVTAAKNKNVTWKIKLQVINGSEIKESYAPAGWKFIDANNAGDKYAYKVFTVRGYYSPVSLEEMKEAKDNPSKITISTEKQTPRSFNVNLKEGVYNVTVRYTDVNGKEVLLAKDKNVSNLKTYKVPNVERSTNVSFEICDALGHDVSKLLLSNWKTSNKESCAVNNYVLKPEKSYEN